MLRMIFGALKKNRINGYDTMIKGKMELPLKIFIMKPLARIFFYYEIIK